MGSFQADRAHLVTVHFGSWQFNCSGRDAASKGFVFRFAPAKHTEDSCIQSHPSCSPFSAQLADDFDPAPRGQPATGFSSCPASYRFGPSQERCSSGLAVW